MRPKAIGNSPSSSNSCATIYDFLHSEMEDNSNDNNNNNNNNCNNNNNNKFYLEENRLLPEEQKGSRRKCQGTKVQLVIDGCTLQNCRKKRQI